MAVWSTVHFSEASANWRFDAEYWKPEFLRNEEYILSSKDKKGLLVSNVYGLVRRIKGSAFYPSFVENYSDRGMPFLRVADIGNLFVSDDQMVRIESDIVHQYRQIAVVSEGDLVLSKGGSIGEVAVVQEGLGKCALCRDVIAAELDEAKVSPYYLAAFLKSRFGQLQLDRNKSQAVQPHLTFPAVGNVMVVVPVRTVQESIATRIKNAILKRHNSRGLYSQAEDLLLSEIGFSPRKTTLSYTRHYSEACAVTRLDAEYFMPKFYRLIDALQGTGSAYRLGDVVEHCDRGLQPEYAGDGDVAVVNTKHMGAQFLSGDYEHCTANSWKQQKKARLRQYDVLFYSTGAYIGRTNCWFETRRAIGSNHVTIIRPKPECNPVYLSLFLNSVVGRMQADRHAHGSAQREVYPSDIRDFTVWLPPMKKQEHFAELILQSKSAIDDSHRLLEEAKELVEKAVMGARNPK